jgi:hypothetical protein
MLNDGGVVSLRRTVSPVRSSVPKIKPAHYRGSYHVRSRRLVAAAYQNPDVRCPRCGLTFLEYAAINGERAARWQAGHARDGEVGGALRPEHARCNAQAGNRARNPTSEDW